MAKSIINTAQFIANLRKFAKSNALFLITAREAAKSGPAKPLRKDGTPTVAALEHVDGFRALLMEKGEGCPRTIWEELGAGTDSSYRGYVTHMAQATVGIWVSGDDAADMTFNALCKAGKAALGKPKAADKENPLDAYVEAAAKLVAAAHRSEAAAWAPEALAHLQAFVAEFTKDEG